MRSHDLKHNKPNRLNLRIRANGLRVTTSVQTTERINLKSIRSISDFDYRRLEEIIAKLPETNPEANLETNFVPQNNYYEEDSNDAWPIEMLDQGITALDQDASEKAVIAWSLNILSRSETARAMITEAAKQGWKIGLDHLEAHDFHLDVPEKTLYVNNNAMRAAAIARSNYFINATMIAIVRGLRDIWQEKRHGGFEENYGPQDILLLERIRAADLDVLVTLVCWDLKFKDYPELWRYLLSSREGDIAMTFNKVLERQSMMELGADAKIAAFRQWFENEERVNNCDHETLDYLDNIAESGEGFGERRPTEIGLEILSCLPDRTAYLKGWGYEIMIDPHYSGMKDEINQSHLMQIVTDLHVTYAGGVPFRDQYLARMMFPEGGLGDGSETLH